MNANNDGGGVHIYWALFTDLPRVRSTWVPSAAATWEDAVHHVWRKANPFIVFRVFVLNNTHARLIELTERSPLFDRQLRDSGLDGSPSSSHISLVLCPRWDIWHENVLPTPTYRSLFALGGYNTDAWAEAEPLFRPAPRADRGTHNHVMEEE